MRDALKFSDRILLRIDAPAHDAVPLLRHAAYTRYVAGAWSAPALPFRPLASDAHGWVLARGDSGKRLGVSAWAAQGRALLALPASTVRVNGLIASSVQANGIGAVGVEGAPQPLVYEA